MTEFSTANRQPEAVRSSDNVLSLSELAENIVSFVRRHFRLIATATIVSVALANFYLLFATPTYTASTSLVLDMRNVSFAPQKPMVTDMALDSAYVESQVEILKARAILVAVIKKLDLTARPEFVESTGGFLGDFKQRFLRVFGYEPTEFEILERALRAFQNKLTVRRVGLSFVIDVSVRSTDPALAAEIANALADAYIADQANARVQITQRATTWLQQSLLGLREQAMKADRAVVEYKARNNIVSAGGKPIYEQQLAELTTQLVAATAQRVEVQARLDRIETVLSEVTKNAATVDAAVVDSLKSEIIIKLRTQYLELANRELDWSSRYGSDHAATIGVRGQKRDIRSSMVDELSRIAETYKSDYEIAKQRQDNIKVQLSRAILESNEVNQAQITVRELESTAQAYRTLYDEFLHRHMETVQQVSFPVSEARVISPAAMPLRVSWPRFSVVVAIALVLGIVGGVSLALLADFRRYLLSSSGMSPGRAR